MACPTCGSHPEYATCIPMCPQLSRRRPGGVYPQSVEERRQMAAVLDWITDGRPLTTPAERAQHELQAEPHERPSGVSPVLAGVAL